MSFIRSKLKQPRIQAALVLVLSLFVGIGTYAYLIGYQVRLESDSELTPVYVASSEIAPGTSYGEITSNNLIELREFPKKSIPLSAITPSTTLDSNLKTRGVLSDGQILVADYFVMETVPDVGLRIPKGMLAVTISVDDVSRVGNFVSPGSRVVIFATSAGGSGSVTRVLLPEALVIGIGAQTSQVSGSSLPTPSPLVTVALPPTDAQKLILASKTSEITLALAYENEPSALLGSSSSSRIESGS